MTYDRPDKNFHFINISIFHLARSNLICVHSITTHFTSYLRLKIIHEHRKVGGVVT